MRCFDHKSIKFRSYITWENFVKEKRDYYSQRQHQPQYFVTISGIPQIFASLSASASIAKNCRISKIALSLQPYFQGPVVHGPMKHTQPPLARSTHSALPPLSSLSPSWHCPGKASTKSSTPPSAPTSVPLLSSTMAKSMRHGRAMAVTNKSTSPPSTAAPGQAKSLSPVETPPSVPRSVCSVEFSGQE